MSVIPHLNIYGPAKSAGMDTMKLVQMAKEKKQIGANEDALIKETGDVKIYKAAQKEKILKKSG
jgi:hypothetical protein